LLDAAAAAPEKARAHRVAILNGLLKSVVVTPRRPAKLVGQPTALAALRNDPNASAKTMLGKVESLLSWPGKPGAPEANAEPLTAAQQKRFEAGKVLYTATCAACHQTHGLGLDGIAPPLADSEWVTGPVERLGRIAINGVRGPIKVGDRRFGMEMPALGVLDDEQLASVFTYIRREWGHTASPVETDAVKQIRAAIAGRQDAWTEAELLKLSAK
jgi:mono/diheme cytochrome c family protein